MDHTSPSTDDPKETLPMLVCPICNRQLILDNANFNKHVDECLSKVEVKAILKDQLESERPSTSYPRSTAKRVKRFYNYIFFLGESHDLFLFLLILGQIMENPC